MRLAHLLALPLVLLVRGYQRFISPMRPQTCRYYPSCSAYAVTALQRHGVVKGTWLAVRRLGRCHPWSEGGVDHVPPRRGEVLDELGRPHPAPVAGIAPGVRLVPRSSGSTRHPGSPPGPDRDESPPD